MPTRHFNAVIDMISEDGQTCTVTFDGYGTTEIARISDLMPRDWEAPMIPVERERAKTSRYMHVCTCVHNGYLAIVHVCHCL